MLRRLAKRGASSTPSSSCHCATGQPHTTPALSYRADGRTRRELSVSSGCSRRGTRRK
jgi:hypothetical protein